MKTATEKLKMPKIKALYKKVKGLSLEIQIPLTNVKFYANEIFGAFEVTIQQARELAKQVSAMAQEEKARQITQPELGLSDKPYEEMKAIEQIIFLHRQGYTNSELVEAGHNKYTVKRQVYEYKKKAQSSVQS